MGYSIDLYKIKYSKIIDRFARKFPQIKADIEMFEKILNSFGNKIGDEYVILWQEKYDDWIED